MNFKKLALASAIATMPMGAFALDEIADEALSDVTGQDGIEMVFQTTAAGLTTDIFIHDTDGLGNGVGATFTGSSAFSFAGAVVIDNMALMVGGNSITISIDAGASATSAGSPVLNVNVALPTALTISTGSIHVANSQRDNSAWSVETVSSTILNNMTIILGNTALNIQLGNEAQTGTTAGTDMMVVRASVTNGISLSGFRLSDATGSGDGGIGMSTMTILDAGGGPNLTLGLDINADDTGLVVGLGQVGSATGGVDIRIADQYLGSTSAGTIGDISIVGLNLNGATLTISGK